MGLKGPHILWLPFLIIVTTQETENYETFICFGGAPVLPISARCDSYPDCPGGEDEHNCVSEGILYLNGKYSILSA